ncbi:hypothetical protein D9M68_20430 [compost metagenome]
MSEALNKVDEKIKLVGAAVEAALSFDDDGAAVIPETFVKDNLAIASGNEELTLETVRLVQNTEATFAGGLALGLGNAALPAMKKNTDMARATASLEFGADVIRAAVDRVQMVRVPTTGEEKEKFGSVSVKLDSGANAKRGDLKRVLNFVGDNFAEAFAK